MREPKRVCPVTGELCEHEECNPECYEEINNLMMDIEAEIAAAEAAEAEAIAEMEMAMMEEEYYEPPPDEEW